MSIPETEWTRALEAIAKADTIGLACHLGPDGDALGSLLALTIALHEQGKKTVASWGSDPFTIPPHYTYLPKLDLLSPPADFPAAPDLMITFDAGSFERLGSLEANARASKQLLVVDHHVSNGSFGSINLVDPDAAASAVIVYELLRR